MDDNMKYISNLIQFVDDLDKIYYIIKIMDTKTINKTTD